MSTTYTDPAADRARIHLVDDDPLRARKDARELLAALSGADPQAALHVPRRETGHDRDKGSVTEVISLVFGGGSFVAAGIQIWLVRVPQRTIIVTRADGATLRVTGRQARDDDQLVQRFLDGAEDTTGGAG
ncbi:hypothetical protein ACIQ9E_00645 [Streptomyces sp. NPDC094448]|uniref:effector-associated constant component EACC1 n=1 Tax=Streptomyces sp. NPDC094448 TaxID=3366063 RepID=UPI003800F1FF